MDTKQEITKIAKDLQASSEKEWLTVDQVRNICASCADKMASKGMTKIKMATFIEAAESWEKCISDAKKNPDVKDPEKLCGWLKSHGPNAPKSEKKGPFKASERIADAWDKLPKGWTKESAKKFWKSLTGDRVHKKTACAKKMKGAIDDPWGFCASLERAIKGE